MIPLCDVSRQYEVLKDEIDAAMQQVAGEGRYILGPQVQQFEREVADFLGCRFAVGVGSGTDALYLALRALNIGPGDEVITTPLTFIATSEAICAVGAIPVFADIDPRTFNLDPIQIAAAVTPQTKAILPVHLFGQPCDMQAIHALAQQHGLKIIEDVAQAMGAEYQGEKTGTTGDAGCFSFFPSKNLGGFGDGGLVATNDEAVFRRVEMLRRHGGRIKYHHSEQGVNSRLDELQAAILRVKLPHLSQWNEARRQAAYHYNALLADVVGVIRPAELTATATGETHVCNQHRGTGNASSSPQELLKPVYHQYTVLVKDREATIERLKAAGVGCAIYYPVPLHLQEVNRGLSYGPGDFPVAESVCQHCLSLPMFPHLSREQQDTVVAALTEAVTDTAGNSGKQGQENNPAAPHLPATASSATLPFSPETTRG